MAERLGKQPKDGDGETTDQTQGQTQGQGQTIQGTGQGQGQGTGQGIGQGQDDEEMRENTFFRLEGLGFRVGQGLAERYVHVPPFTTTIIRGMLYLRCLPPNRQANVLVTLDSFSRDRPRFSDHLDVIKFLCKDLWVILFRKQIDNLKTNHRVPPPSLPPSLPVTHPVRGRG